MLTQFANAKPIERSFLLDTIHAILIIFVRIPLSKVFKIVHAAAGVASARDQGEGVGSAAGSSCQGCKANMISVGVGWKGNRATLLLVMGEKLSQLLTRGSCITLTIQPVLSMAIIE